MTTTTYLDATPSISRRTVILVTARGQVKRVKTPSDFPPPCIVRAGDAPDLWMPVVVRGNS